MKAARARLPCSYMLSVRLGSGGRCGRHRKKLGLSLLGALDSHGVHGVLQLLELRFCKLLDRHGLGLAEKLLRLGRKSSRLAVVGGGTCSSALGTTGKETSAWCCLCRRVRSTPLMEWLLGLLLQRERKEREAKEREEKGRERGREGEREGEGQIHNHQFMHKLGVFLYTLCHASTRENTIVVTHCACFSFYTWKDKGVKLVPKLITPPRKWWVGQW